MRKNMKFSDEQIRDILKLKDHILDEIEKHKEKIEMLEKNLNILNLTLKESSFTKASALSSNEAKMDSTTSIPITKGSGGEVIANAYVTPDKVSIVLNE